LCRQHALVLELELEDHSQAGDFLGIVDRFLTGRNDELTRNLTGFLGGLLGARVVQHPSFEQAKRLAAEAVMRARAQQQQRPRPAAPPPRPAAPPDPALRAREILGFEPTEPLTAQKVQDRKRALAKVFHPDLQSGSTAQMARVLTAADLLLAKLS
jgi:hypothetical protein